MVAVDLRAKLKTEVQRYRNKEFLKAMMAVCALTALADGEYQISERYQVEEILKTTDALKIFDRTKAVQILDEYLFELKTKE